MVSEAHVEPKIPEPDVKKTSKNGQEAALDAAYGKPEATRPWDL